MNTVFHGHPKDGGEEQRIELERQLTDCLRRTGFANVKVRIERHSGRVVLSDTEEDLKTAEHVRGSWKLPGQGHNLSRQR